MTVSDALCGNPPWSVLSARADSPSPPPLSSVLVPSAPPSAIAATTKAIHPQIAVLRWPALQRPARPASPNFLLLRIMPSVRYFEVDSAPSTARLQPGASGGELPMRRTGESP